MKKLNFGYKKIDSAIDVICGKIKSSNIDLIVAIGRGGFVPSVYLAHRLNIKNMTACFVNTYDEGKRKEDITLNDIDLSKMPKIGNARNILVVDDIVDSGYTMTLLREWFTTQYPETVVQYACLVYKPVATFSDVICGFEHCGESWVRFPWEARPQLQPSSLI